MSSPTTLVANMALHESVRVCVHVHTCMSVKTGQKKEVLKWVIT